MDKVAGFGFYVFGVIWRGALFGFVAALLVSMPSVLTAFMRRGIFGDQILSNWTVIIGIVHGLLVIAIVAFAVSLRLLNVRHLRKLSSAKTPKVPLFFGEPLLWVPGIGQIIVNHAYLRHGR